MTMIEKIEELMICEWVITIEQEEGNYESYAQRGDFNCPHRKEYDPKDGHGVSQVWAEGDKLDNRSHSLEESIEKLFKQCIDVVPGKPYEKGK